MLAEDRIPNERLNLNQRLTFLIKAINETPRGKEIFLSRSAPDFVAKLFAREVPEIASNAVEIKAIAREAGVRTKVAVFSAQSGVDPVGSCVGQKGVRVQAVTNEIGGERVDVIPWSEDVSELIKSSLSPAENLSVMIDKDQKLAKVIAPEDQLSMAIGKDGQNVRLTAKLTGYRIEVEGSGETLEAKKEGQEVKKEISTEGEEKEEIVKKERVEVEPESETEKVEKKEDTTTEMDSMAKGLKDTASEKSDEEAK
jgi:N utilization substance protein A